MAPLFELAGPDLDPGYLNLRAAEYQAEQVIKAALEGMWVRFEPYADADFAMAFAHDPDARFWEMYLDAHCLTPARLFSCARIESKDREIPTYALLMATGGFGSRRSHLMLVTLESIRCRDSSCLMMEELYRRSPSGKYT